MYKYAGNIYPILKISKWEKKEKINQNKQQNNKQTK